MDTKAVMPSVAMKHGHTIQWIEGEQLPDGSIKINGKIYKENTPDPDNYHHEYRIKDGWVFIFDENHRGSILMTERVAKKWGLDIWRMLPFEREEYLEGGWDPKFTHDLSISHMQATINGDGEEILNDSPFGQLYTEEFIAWWYDIDPRFFGDLPEEDLDEVDRRSWCDG